MPIFSKLTDVELLAWMDNFIVVATVDPAKYGVKLSDITSLHGKADDLRSKIALRQTAEAAAKAAVKSQQASRDDLESEVATLAANIKNNKNVTDADKEAINIDTPKPRSKTAPTRPENLVAEGFADGRNVLKWDRAGNKPNTVFVVECKAEDETAFSYLQSVTATKCEHKNVKPGKHYAYRVKAQKSGEESTYSNEATVY